MKSVNGFILEKYWRWSHTDKKEKRMSLFLSSMYICVIMTFADVFVGSVLSFIHLCHTFMTSKYGRHDVAFYHLCISFCKVYIQMVMTLSLAVSSLSVSVCHSRKCLNLFP